MLLGGCYIPLGVVRLKSGVQQMQMGRHPIYSAGYSRCSQAREMAKRRAISNSQRPTPVKHHEKLLSDIDKGRNRTLWKPGGKRFKIV
ncbi:hypothetical protein AAHA92_15744 [Salvia divinorum]|uniref:Uncharacterized protein n=1 Tax=Salvia divinorum TaxID=28513 RepID=A0ABD1HJQ7_SALDI